MQEAVKIEEMSIEDLIERYHMGKKKTPTVSPTAKVWWCHTTTFL